MAVTFDALATGGNGTNGHTEGFTVTTTLTAVTGCTITIGATANLLLVFLALQSNSDGTWVVKCGGVGGTTMTEVPSSFVAAGAASGCSVRCFSLNNPPTGAQTFAVSNTLGPLSAVIMPISFKGAGGGLSPWTNSNSALTNSTASTGASPQSIPNTDMAAAMFGDPTAGFLGATQGNTGGTGLTNIDDNEAVSTNAAGSYISGNNNAITLTYSINGTDAFAAVGIWIQQSSATALGKTPSTLLLPPRRGMVGWRGLTRLQAFPVPSASIPFRQTDWPLPQSAEPSPYRSFEWDNRKILIGQDALPARQRDWPLPGNPETYPYRSFEWDNRQILTGQDRLPFRQTDWPVPLPADSPDARRSWSWSFPLPLIGKDQLPFRQTDWPLPTAVEPDWRRSWTQSLLQTTLTPAVVIPFRQTDWQIPLGAEPDWRRSWSTGFNPNLIGQDALPFRQRDWPLPDTPPLLKTDQPPNLVISTTVVIFPFRQTDWPLPGDPEPNARRSWASSYNLNLIGQDTLPFRQRDWPLPQPAEPDARRSLSSGFNLNLIGQDHLPFRQMDWPLPLPASTWSPALVIPNLVINVPPPPAGTTVQLITSMGLFFNPGASAIP